MSVSRLDLRHRMSALPSPLKSPTPAICQSLVTTPSEAVLVTVSSFISHMSTSPEVLRHRMSALRLPLNSPIPAICQSRLTVPSEPPETKLVSFISHKSTSPEVLRHRMSALPSPLKSRQHSVFATTTSEAQLFDGAAAAVLVSPAVVVPPSTVQMLYWRTLLAGKPVNVSEFPVESLSVGKLVPVP